MKKTHLLALLVFCLVSCNVFGQGYSGLIGRWPLNGSAADVSGNGLNGIVVGATPTTGSTGLPNTAYHFDGVSNYSTL